MFVPPVWSRGTEQAYIVGRVTNPNVANKSSFVCIMSVFLTSVLVFSDSKGKNRNVFVRSVHKVRNFCQCKIMAGW